MRYYNWLPVAEGYREYLIVEELYDITGTQLFDLEMGQTLTSDAGMHAAVDCEGPRLDILSQLFDMKIVSERLCRALQEIAPREICCCDIALSMKSTGVQICGYRYCHILNPVDCIDLKRTRHRKKPEADNPDYIELLDFSNPVTLDPSRIGDRKIFRLKRHEGFVIIREDVVEMIESSGYTGLGYREVRVTGSGSKRARCAMSSSRDAGKTDDMKCAATKPSNVALERELERAELHFSDGQYREAEEILRRCFRTAEELGVKGTLQARFLNCLAGVCRQTVREQEALELCQRAFWLMQPESRPGDANLAGIARNIAEMKNGSGDVASSLEWYERCLEIAKQAGPDDSDPLGVCQSLHGMAGVYRSIGKRREEMDCLEQALSVAKDSRLRNVDAEMAIAYSDALSENAERERAVRVVAELVDEYVHALNEPADTHAAIDPEAMAFEGVKAEFQEERREPPALLLLRIQLVKLRHLSGETNVSLDHLTEMGTFEGRIYGKGSLELGIQYQQVGIALHRLGQQTGDRNALISAKSFYVKSLRILRKQCAPSDPLLAEAISNMDEVRNDLRGA